MNAIAEPKAAAPAPMDTEQVFAAAQQAAGAVVNILNLIGWRPEEMGSELEDIAVELAQALDAVLSWHPKLDGEANQLLGALQRYLP